MFPEQFRDQMLEQANAEASKKEQRRDSYKVNGVRNSLKLFVSDEPELMDDDEELFLTKPVASLFPEATVIMADIVGFSKCEKTSVSK